MTPPQLVLPRLVLPDGPALAAGFGTGVLLFPDGTLEPLAGKALAARLAGLGPPLVCHAPATLRRLGLSRLAGADVLELFAFCRPAEFCVPTPCGLAAALGLPEPHGPEAAAALLAPAAIALLRGLAAARAAPRNRDAAGLAALMGRAGWAWAGSVLAALGQPHAAPAARALSIAERLPEWEDAAPPPPPGSQPVSGAEARARLASLLGEAAELRPGQADFAAAAAEAFAPRAEAGAPRLVLAEAGTGTGKTLGYIAPASLWAEKNGAAVWLSTYTRNLQRQLDAELARLYPDERARARHVVVRKGRENYLCLLNFEEAAGAAAGTRAIALALLARWAGFSRDGDVFGDLPGWMHELFGPALSGLTDRRGECIHAACPHWRKCFVERSIRHARQARLVVANHALVMIQAAWAAPAGAGLPTRYVFDEGHHVFDAADSAFSAALTGTEMAELRRWLLGAEGRAGRARGLDRRIGDLCATPPTLAAMLAEALAAARALPGPGWQARLDRPAAPDLAGVAAGQQNPGERFLRAVARQVLARAPPDEAAPELEAPPLPAEPFLSEAAAALHDAIGAITAPLGRLARGLAQRLEDEAETIESAGRSRIEGALRGLDRRALRPLAAWRAMLARLAQAIEEPEFVDWLSLSQGRAGTVDAGMHRHWIDPTLPFAEMVARPAHGLLVTSATLRDAGEPDPEAAWAGAEARIGAPHLAGPASRAALKSPFDYPAQARAFVVTDLVRNGPPEQLAAAFRALFVAAGGGALGLFTAIARLRAVHARLAAPLAEAGIDLYAQHVDAMDNATLVDIFRAEEDACLLGTDAMRDGVDVPGRALRLVVFDRVPWPRPDILHKARRTYFGPPKEYDEAIARAKLRQAFGRLIRKEGDRGAFVLLDRATPSRLLAALPVPVERVGLADAVGAVARFLKA
ncbi:MAG: ATP-dependent DNA helicase [Acetobacteraceae bacterium]|nr:ATP-dependent DNA helicase [Acetobacteraceae bacterium]